MHGLMLYGLASDGVGILVTLTRWLVAKLVFLVTNVSKVDGVKAL